LRSGALLLLLTLAGSACTPAGGGWDVRRIEQRYPEVAAHAGHRLGELAPHFWIAGDELLLFVCRWSGERPVRVWTQGATAAEARLLGRALAALEASLAGLRLELVATAGSAGGIAVAFQDAVAAGDPAAIRSGDAVADCRVDDAFAGARAGEQLSAQLEAASVRILRSRLDWLGRVVALDELELFAALLHELGHAIGYSSHASGGPTLMRAAPSEVRLRARSVLRGAPLRDRTLASLYALPSGAVLRRDPLGPEVAATARVFADLARSGDWGRPRSRAGQDSAELWWKAGVGKRSVLRASRLGRSWPEGFSLRANATARAALRSALR
jgi:hypothetical protein